MGTYFFLNERKKNLFLYTQLLIPYFYQSPEHRLDCSNTLLVYSGPRKNVVTFLKDRQVIYLLNLIQVYNSILDSSSLSKTELDR